MVTGRLCSDILARFGAKLTADPNEARTLYHMIAIGVVAPGQDHRDTSEDFIIRNATVSEFNTTSLEIRDWDTYEELTKEQIKEEVALNAAIVDALMSDELERREEAARKEAIFGTADFDWDAHSAH